MKSNLANLVITFRLFFTQNPGDPNNHSWSNKQTYHLQCHTFDPTKTPLTTNDLVPMSTNQSLFICGPGVIGFWILTEKQKSYFEKNGINLRKTGEIHTCFGCKPVMFDSHPQWWDPMVGPHRQEWWMMNIGIGRQNLGISCCVCWK